jgi:Lar family restriction alleviation protein
VKLKPCPFCGGEAKITFSDAEGNMRDAEYANDPWSGLMFRIYHPHEDNEGCPIANYDCDGGSMGVYLYETKEEAAEAWNKRT